MGAATVIGIGAGLQAYGQYAGLRASAVSEKYQAQIDRNNAKIQKERIKDVTAIGAKEAKRLEQETVQFATNQITGFASSNIDIASAVVTEAVEETARVGAADIITLQHNIEREIWGIETGIAGLEAQAQLRESQARQTEKLAPIAAGATLLSGFGGIATRKQEPESPLKRTT
jgi:hypothetical protein